MRLFFPLQGVDHRLPRNRTEQNVGSPEWFADRPVKCKCSGDVASVLIIGWNVCEYLTRLEETEFTDEDQEIAPLALANHVHSIIINNQ